MADPTSKAVFLSYASQDADAARRICEALRAVGVEVWFDQSELRGGDAWDAKIRKQIKDCALFVPVISANTQARREGYFRLEWKLADDRTHLMAKGTPFVVPVCVDTTRDGDALVPDSFLAVQWVRLPNGDALSVFCSRVRALLHGSGGRERGDSVPAVDTTGPRSAPNKIATSRLVGVVAFVLGLVVALAVWRPWRITEGAKPAGAAISAPGTPATQQLVAKARAIFHNGEEARRENFFFAEDILKQAVAQDVANAEAWAAYGQLSVDMYRFGVDRSTTRIEAMRSQVDRALRLDPDSIEARVAQASAADYLGLDPNAAEASLRELAQRAPSNRFVLQALSRKLGRSGKVDEAIVFANRAAALSTDSTSAWDDVAPYTLAAGRFADAEAIVAKSLARGPSARAMAIATLLKLGWHGDHVAATAGVATWPDWFLLEDRGGAIAGLVALWSRDPAKALALYQRLPRDYLRDTYFTGPRAALTAFAHAQAGHREAARADWQRALQVAERESAADLSDGHPLYWRAWALAELGDRAGAETLRSQIEQRNWQPTSYYSPDGGLIGLALALGDTEKALAALERAVTPRAETDPLFKSFYLNYCLPRSVLELNPIFDPLRGDERFRRLLAKAPAPDSGAPTAARNETRSIAVLPFVNRSDDKQTEDFSDGISEELLNLLGRVPGLRVAGWTSALTFKGKNAAAREIGDQLGVAHFVDGSVRKSGSRVQIRARLTRTGTNDQIWSDTYEEELKDIFSLQDKIARDIAQKLQLTLGAPSRVARAVNPEAHQLVLEGRRYWNQRTEGELALAEEKFSRAVAVDSLFAPAYAGLADACIMTALYAENNGAADVRAIVARGRAAAVRTSELDPTLAEPLAATAYAAALEGDLAGADQFILKALAINPSYATAHQWRGVLLARQGRLEDALGEFETAVGLDPLAFVHRWMFGEALSFAGRDDDALRMLERSASLRDQSMFMPLVAQLAVAELKAGRTEKALARARSIRDSWPPKTRWWADGYAVWVMRRCGQAAEAEAYARMLADRLTPESYQRGIVLTALGRFDEALPYLERTPQIARRVLFWAEMFDPYRDRRMDALMRKLGCAEDYRRAREAVTRLPEPTANK